MNIGLDIDGVLFNQEKFQLKKGIKHFKKQYLKNHYLKTKEKLKISEIQVFDLATNRGFNGKEIDLTRPYIEINSNGYGVDDVFNCSEREEEKFWYKYMLPYALFTPFRKDADRIIKKLRNEGNKIIAVTSRAKSNEKNIVGAIQRGILIFRLKMKGVPYDKIVFCSYKNGQEVIDKANACLDNNIEIMIEDKKDNAEAIEKVTNTKTFLYATRNNADINSKNVIRFVNFSELYNGIKKLQSNDMFELLGREEKEKLTSEERQKYYENYRLYIAKNTYDQEIVRLREEKLKKTIRRGRYVFDRFVKHKAINIEKAPSEKGVIITTNHRDLLDIPLVMRTIGERPYHPMLKSEFLDTKAEGVFTEFGSIFVNRRDRSIREQARETGIKMLLMESDVIVCPEGTRNKTDKPLLDFDFGAVSMAQNANRPIYPCAIYKGQDGKIINFGEPIYVNSDSDLQKSNELLYNQTLHLLNECKREDEKVKKLELTNRHNNR